MFFGWKKLFLILTVLPTCSSLHVSIPENEYEVAREGDVTLSCSFVPAQPVVTNFLLRWDAYPDNDGDPLNPVATYFLNNAPDIAPPYEGRARLEVSIDRGVSSLTLTKVTMQDSRRYQCSVIILRDDEGVTAASTSILVLVPPSAPICSIQGTAEYFHDITLTCDSKEGSPTPTYDWKRYSVNNLPQPFPPKTTSKDGALSLFNVSKEMSGFYICASVNRIGSASCNLTLSVMPPSSNSGATAGIIAGVVAGLILLLIVVYCFCRKKGQKNAYEEGSPREMEFFDKDAPETGEQYADDKSNSDKKQANKNKDNDIVPEDSYAVRGTLDDDQRSFSSNKGSDMDSHRYKDDRDQPNHPRDHYKGSRDRLDNQRDDYRESRDRLEDHPNDYRGSRDRLDDRGDQYRGSRDHLDNQRDDYRGSRDRLDDRRDQNRGSRDRLEDHRNDYRGSRDRLDDRGDQYRGSRDHLDDQRNDYRRSRDRLEDQRDHYRGSRDRLDHNDEPYRREYD